MEERSISFVTNRFNEDNDDNNTHKTQKAGICQLINSPPGYSPEAYLKLRRKPYPWPNLLESP